MTQSEFTPFTHQQKFADKWKQTPGILCLDECGTGKTLGHVHAVKQNWPHARVLVLGTKSTLETAWADDIKFGWPQTTIAVAAGTAKNKRDAFTSGAQWVVTNHDSVSTIVDEGWHKQFDIVITDEADAFRNHTTGRSKAIRRLYKDFEIKSVATGTPTPNTVVDLWHLVMLIDGGERLGRDFFSFRKEVCIGIPIYGAPPGAMDWRDKEEANDLVTMRTADIATRVRLEDVTELPETTTKTIGVTLPKKLRTQYLQLRDDSILEHNGEVYNAVNAGSRINKMLQLLSGAMYDEEGAIVQAHKARYDLVGDLANQTDHCLIAFNWRHQKEGITKALKSRGRTFEVIDGSTPQSKRSEIVRRFQAGEINDIVAHPQSAGHGLTLTRANRIIWASPIYRADLYEQFNARIVRNGQKRRTQILCIAARDTEEEKVYELLQAKRASMADLLNTFYGLTHFDKAA